LKGQFTILSAVTLMIAIITISIIIANANLRLRRYQEYSLPPIIINILQDYSRMLSASLSKATNEAYSVIYLKRGNINYAVKKAEDISKNFVDKWIKSFIDAYAGLGVNLNVKVKLDLRWSKGTSWASILTGELIVEIPSIGFKLNRIIKQTGISIERVFISKIGKQYYLHVIGISLDEGRGIPLKIEKLIIDGREVNFYHYYLGGGLNRYLIKVREIHRYVEGYFEYNNIIIRVYLEI